MEDIKKIQIKHVKTKTMIYEMKKILNGIDGRLDIGEENIRELENKAIETMHT